MTGSVALVGAGPGDPELLTVRALNRLRDADLVLYDALTPEALLALAPNAKRFFVGKRAGRHSIAGGGLPPAGSVAAGRRGWIEQAEIHRLMIRAARRGERVVRLKCGDPFVLGRGGEEALALDAAGVAYEVVPGLSSALAAPALAGIPVTHRGVATGFAVISGHAASAYEPVIDSVAPGALTLVVLMGLRTRRELAARLVARGWSAETPAAIVLAASQPNETRYVGTLATLGDLAEHQDAESPGVIVIGEVVRLADAIGRREVILPEAARSS